MTSAETVKLVRVEFETTFEAVVYDDPGGRTAIGRLVLATYDRKKKDWKRVPISDDLRSWQQLDEELSQLQRQIDDAKHAGRRFLPKNW